MGILQPITFNGIAEAAARADRVDALIIDLARNLPDDTAVIALGAYGRRELTPRGDVEFLLLHQGNLNQQQATEHLAYPLWQQSIRGEPTVRTLQECHLDARRSWAAVTSLLDARLVTGNQREFNALNVNIMQPWRRDLERLRHRLRTESARRHATHPPATSSTTPDLIGGRGGLLDLNALRWLGIRPDNRLHAALDFLLRAMTAAEELGGTAPHRLTVRIQERIAAALHYPHGVEQLAEDIARHARWIAFLLDGALSPSHDDRQVGPSLAIRNGKLAADRLPPIDRSPSVGLRIANLVGLAPPDRMLLDWASIPGPEIPWDDSAIEQFWLLLRAADWRAWEFLDVTGLLTRYLPELAGVCHKRHLASVADQALDTHSFHAVRRLHEWTDTDEPLAERAWRPIRRRDSVYLGVLLHELDPAVAMSAARRLGLSDEVASTIAFAIENRRLLVDTAMRRDVHDEELVLQLVSRIATRRLLSVLFLVAVAHELAIHSTGWTRWQADLVRQLYVRLDAVLREKGELGSRRTRSLEQHRARILHQLEVHGRVQLESVVARLPRRYVLAHSPAFIARHLALLDGPPLTQGEVRLQAHRHRQRGLWDVQIVARDRPGLLATMAGVFSLRGVSVLAADAATTSDGLALDVFTVAAAYGVPLERDRWPAIADDVQAALEGRLPLADLLGARPLQSDDADAIHVTIDNEASQFFSIVEVRAPDQVGLLYRIAQALHELGLDIHQAKIATHPEGALDVFYVRDLSGEKLDVDLADEIAARLRGQRPRD